MVLYVTVIRRLGWKSLVIACCAFLSACVGTGTKDYSAVVPVISQNAGGKVFIGRPGGYVGAAAVMAVDLNGKRVGELGDGEMLIADARPGDNVIQVRIEGLQGIGMNSPTSEFKSDGVSNNFYLVQFDVGLITNKMMLIETTENGWKQQLK